MVTTTIIAICHGTFSVGTNCSVRAHRRFATDDMRKTTDPKFQPPHFAEYLNAASRLDEIARENFGKHAIHVAVAGCLINPVLASYCGGARHPEQLASVSEVSG